jgi:predicted HD phosphohydrolase
MTRPLLRWLQFCVFDAGDVIKSRAGGVCRYLCGTNAAYYDGLSSASKRSLELQGGPFVPDECKAFETRPFAMDAVQVRQWDDQAKVGGMSTAGLESFMPHVEAAAKAASATM